MMTLTHLTAGAAATAGILQTSNPTLLIIGAISSLLPDVDLSVSPAGRVLFFISYYLEKHFPHRGPTHSIFICSLVSFTCYLVCLYFGINPQIAIAVFIGYSLGGIFPDCLTKSGAAIFWPLDNLPWWFPDNHRYRLSTGSRIEYVLLTFLLMGTILLFNINSKGGLEIGFGRLLGTTSGVETVYNTYGSDKLINIKIEGVRSDTRNPVTGEFTLIQSLGQGFIVKNNQEELFKVSSEPDAQIIPKNITAKPGKPATTLIQNISINDEAIAPKIVQIYQSYPKAEIYLSGSINLEEADEFNPVSLPGQLAVIRKYSSTAELQSCPIKLAYQQLAAHWGTGSLTARIIIKK